LVEIYPLAAKREHSIAARSKILLHVARKYAAGVPGIELVLNLFNSGRGTLPPVLQDHPYGGRSTAVLVLLNEGDIDPERLRQRQQGQK
jgi:hypothetical protein